MPITVNDIAYPEFNITRRGSAEELVDILKSDLRQFRIRMYVIIAIITVMITGSVIFFELMPLIFVFGLSSLFIAMFNMCVRGQDINLDEFWLAFRRGSFWLLWTGEIVQHNRIKTWNFVGKSGLKNSNYVQITPSLHLAASKKAAVALKLVIP